MTFRYLYFFLFILGVTRVGAQTCCSGGVPVSSNLGMPSSDAGAIQLSLNYDNNSLNTLKTGRETLDDRNRNRTTHSVLFEAGYSISKRWSADLLLSFVRQERNVNNFGTDQFTETSGLGDGTLLLKYLLVNKTSWTMSTGVGVKAPLGSSDLRNDLGITLGADLQPGSGAWDGIGWLSISRSSSSRSSSSIYANLIYALKGHNPTYLGSQDYKFGDEFQAILGWGDRALLFNQIFDINFATRFRYALPDQNEFLNVPSTGGSWIFANPGIAWWPTPNFSFQTNIELPVFASITGTQVTPSFRLNAGVYFLIPNSQINLDYEK